MLPKIQYISVDNLVLLENNPRKISDQRLEALKEKLTKLPKLFEKRPCLVSTRTGKNVVYAGNQRLRAARELGLKEVPCIISDDLTEEEEKAEAVVDNIQEGEWVLDHADWQEEFVEWGLIDFENEYVPENKEIDYSDLGDKSVLSFKYEYSEYLKILDLLNNAMEKLECETNEETLSKLLSQYA